MIIRKERFHKRSYLFLSLIIALTLAFVAGCSTTGKPVAEYSEKTVLVEGHTDSVGSDSLNQDLSERRALSVKNALLQVHVDHTRIDTLGLGETTPIADNGTSAGRLKNRRVEILIRD